RLAALDANAAEAEQALALYTAVIANGSQIETYGVPVDIYASYGAATTRRLLGEISYEQGDPAQAEQLIDEAVALLTAIIPPLTEIDDFRLHAQMYQALGTAYEWQRYLRDQRGDTAGRDEATQNARDAYNQCIAVGEIFPFDTDVVGDIVENQCRPRLEQLSNP
ncbi:MAG: hypothetical protein IAF02_27540, partial [Anaerolineae bacterium]|nr:hypothetical protein [Anaerolineae bacterium]